MEESIEGISLFAANCFNRQAAAADEGRRIIARIKRIESDLSTLAACKEVSASSVNNCSFRPAIDQSKLRNWIVTELEDERGGLIDEFNRKFSNNP
jgi:hypothetical protein